MEMWKMLTQKFKSHSLDEDIESFQSEVDDRDSGTESDEENAELQAIEEAMQEQSRQDQENQPQVLPPVGGNCPGFQPLTFPPCASPQFPLQLVTQTMVPFQSLSHNTHFSMLYAAPERASPQELTSDYEFCSLDYEPSSGLEFDASPGGSVEFEPHSSEDELTFINCGSAMSGGMSSGRGRELPNVPEKRKWSQRCNSCNDSSGSSDEEVRDLLGQPKPLNFSSSPPSGVRRVSRALLSPKLFLARLPANSSVRLCTLSPRKRHRPLSATDVSDATTVIQRPCLDFEKMQKTLFRRRLPHGVTKTRIVKIRLGLLKGSM